MFYVTADGAYLALLAENGVLDFSHNWLKPGWVNSHDVLAGTINHDGTSVTGAAPGFVNEGAQDFHLADGSPCVNAGTELNAAVLPANDVVLQYVTHQQSEPRPYEPPLDLGAYERCTSGTCGAADADADGDIAADADADVDTDGNGDTPGDARPDAASGGDGGGCGCRATGEAGAIGDWLLAIGVAGILLGRWYRKRGGRRAR